MVQIMLKDAVMEVKVPITNTLKKVRISFYEILVTTTSLSHRYKREFPPIQASDDTSSLDPS